MPRPTVVVQSVLVLVLLAGCFGGASDGNKVRSGGPPGAGEEAPDGTSWIGCHILGSSGEEVAPLASATCHFEFDSFTAHTPVDPDGWARHAILNGSQGVVRGTADGYASKSAALVVDAPKVVEMTLEPATATSNAPRPSGTNVPTSAPAAVPTPESPRGARSWLAPLTVSSTGNEPQMAADSQGTLYYSPTSQLWKSTDAGKHWIEVIVTAALPTLGSDTAVQVAPDNSVWFSRYWAYAGTTLGCTSKDRGDTWTCDNAAIPGATDRMWIAGLNSQEGYVQTNEGLYHHIWAHTTTGSAKYVPYATTTTLLAVRNGNMVYDEKNKAVYQVEFVGGVQRIYRVDGLGGLLTATETSVPATYALPWLSVRDGVLWTTGEPTKSDGSRSVQAARSTDGGKTWKKFTVSQSPASATFSYVAAGPDGRVAIVYYGSDKTGASTSNMGSWALYVAETENGLDANPTWVETRVVPLVHKGNICIGLNCEQNGGDTYARFSGDLIGIVMDPQGNAHVAYNEDLNAHKVLNRYIGQVRV